MTWASIQIARLRSAGILIRAEGNRLIIEAPSGLLTAEVRTELSVRKAELIEALEQEGALFGAQSTTDAVEQIAALLSAAYRRYSSIRRMPIAAVEDPVNKELALSAHESVHGHGQPL